MESRVPNQDAWKVNSFGAGCSLAPVAPEPWCLFSLPLLVTFIVSRVTDYLELFCYQHLSNHCFTNHVIPFLRSYIFLSIAIICERVCVYEEVGGEGGVCKAHLWRSETAV